MQINKLSEIQKGIENAFIVNAGNTNLAYKPQFLFNDSKNGQKVLSDIDRELKNCNTFIISVAFITRSGITPLLQTLKELEQKGVKGRILTTDYLCFSDPKALDVLNELGNIELRVYLTEKSGNGFHTKGYIFQKDEEYKFIIGSSNLTQDALTKNMEWNTKLVSTNKGEMVNSILCEFEKLWNETEFTKPYNEIAEEYKAKFEEKQLYNKIVAEQQRIAKNELNPSIEAYKLKPNSMQSAFIYNLLEKNSKYSFRNSI